MMMPIGNTWIVHVEKPKEYGASSYMWFASGDADTSDQENYNP